MKPGMLYTAARWTLQSEGAGQKSAVGALDVKTALLNAKLSADRVVVVVPSKALGF